MQELLNFLLKIDVPASAIGASFSVLTLAAILKPWWESKAKAAGEKAANVALEQRRGDLAKELEGTRAIFARELEHHRTELARSLEASKTSFQRSLADYSIFAEKQQDAIASLHAVIFDAAPTFYQQQQDDNTLEPLEHTIYRIEGKLRLIASVYQKYQLYMPSELARNAGSVIASAMSYAVTLRTDSNNNPERRKAMEVFQASVTAFTENCRKTIRGESLDSPST